MLTIGIDAYILLLRAQAGEGSAKEHLANIEQKRQTDLEFWTSISIEEMRRVGLHPRHLGELMNVVLSLRLTLYFAFAMPLI